MDDALEWVWEIAKIGSVVALLFFGVSKCQDSDWYKESERASAAAAKERATPHVIREADGCKVYAFEREGRDHYFTRCGDVVTTERTYTEPCGKGCTKTKSEEITTRGNKCLIW